MLWKEQYKLGVSRIDAQHRELFRRVESFLQVLCGQRKAGIIKFQR